MNRIIILAMGLALTLVAAAQAQPSDKDKAGALLKQASKAMAEKRYADLVDPANQILALSSVTDMGRSLAYYMRGVGYWGKKDYQACITDLSNRAKISRTDVEANAGFWLGHCQVDARQYDAAIATLTKLMTDVDPKNINYSLAALHLGRAWAGKKNYQNALSAVTKATVHLPKWAWAWRNQSVYMRKTGDLDGSLAAANRALAIDPEYVSALESKASTLERKSDWKAMLVTAQKWLSLQPNNKNAQFNVALAQLHDKQYIKARDGFAKLTAKYPGYMQAWNNLGAAEHSLGHHPASRQAVGRALALDPENAMANGNYGIVLYFTGEYAKAIFYLQKAIAGGDTNSDVPRYLKNAQDKVAAGVKAKPKTTQELFAAADKLLSEKKYAEAATAFASLLQDKRIGSNADKMSIKEEQGIALHYQKKYCQSAALIEEAQGLKRAKTYENLIGPAFQCAVTKKTAGDTDAEIRWAMAALDAAINANKAGSKNSLVNQAVNVANASFALCSKGKWSATSAAAKTMADKWKGGTPLERATLVRCAYDPLSAKLASVRAAGSTGLFNLRTTEQNLFNKLTLTSDSKTQIRDWWKASVHFFKLKYGGESVLAKTKWSKLEKL